MHRGGPPYHGFCEEGPSLGDECRCTVRWGEQAGEGRALLETDLLLFRGPFRLAIPLAAMRQVQAEAGELQVTWEGGTAAFVLGERAVRWAEKILHPRSRLDKLDVAPGAAVCLLGLNVADFAAELQQRPVRFAPVEAATVLFLATATPADLAPLPALAAAMPRTAALWVVAPRGSRDLPESAVLGAGRAAGLTDTKVARFSATHTAHKFVVPVSRRYRAT